MRNPIQLLKDAVSIVRENPALFFGILLIPTLLSVIAASFEPARDTGITDLTIWLTFAVLTLITAITNIFMGIALILAINNRSLTVSEAYKSAATFFWRYIGLSILTSLAITIGFILLIIPGVIVSVWLAFASMVLVLERSEIVEAMKRSKEYVRGKWWGVFGRLIAATFIALLTLAILFGVIRFLPIPLWVENMIMSLVSMLIAPVMVGYMYLMYQDLKGSGTGTSTNPYTPEINPESTLSSASNV